VVKERANYVLNLASISIAVDIKKLN